MLDSFVRLSY